MREAVRYITSVLVALAVFAFASGGLEYVFHHRTFTPVKHIVMNPGGGVFEFVEEMSEDRNAGVKYELDGPCISACTFVLGEIPPQNVCVTPYAMMGFHSAYSMEGPRGHEHRVFDPEINDMLWRIYPAWVRDWLHANGWDNPYVDQEKLLWMGNDVLRQHYRAC